jgi:hypothetical protein
MGALHGSTLAIHAVDGGGEARELAACVSRASGGTVAAQGDGNVRRPQPNLQDTPRQRAAAHFVFVHFALTFVYGHDAWSDFRVRKSRREYLNEVTPPTKAIANGSRTQ